MDYSKYKVSFIVPVYNVEPYIAKCIESILSQTHKNLEIICINDGSTDRSLAILESFCKRDSRVKVVTEKNSGVSTARNAGIDIATGDYICFADADDYVMPDYVEYMLKLAVDNDADISLTTDMFTTFHPQQVKEHTVSIKTPKEATIDILTYRMPIGVYCKMFRRSFLGKEIRFIPHIYIGEGFNFNTTALQRANKIVEGNRRIYFYRRDNPTSATTKFRLDKWENAIYAIENIRRNMILHSDSIKIAWRYANWHTHCDAYNFLVMANEQNNYPERYKEWRKVVKNDAHYAFMVSIPTREKIRGIIAMFYPKLIPWLISQRNKRYM